MTTPSASLLSQSLSAELAGNLLGTTSEASARAASPSPAQAAQRAEEEAAAAAEMAKKQQVDNALASLRELCAETQDRLDDAFVSLDPAMVRPPLGHFLQSLSEDARRTLTGDTPGAALLSRCPRGLRGQVRSTLDMCLQYNVFDVATTEATAEAEAKRRPDPQAACVRFIRVYGTLLNFEDASLLFNQRRWQAALKALEQTRAAEVKAVDDEMAALLSPAAAHGGGKDRDARSGAKPTNGDRLRALQAHAARGPIQAQLRALRELTAQGEAKQAAAFAVQRFPTLRLHNVQALQNAAVERAYLNMLLGPQAPAHAAAARRDAVAVQRWMELLLENLGQAAQAPRASFVSHVEEFEEDGGLEAAPASAWEALLASRPVALEEDERLRIMPVASALDAKGRPACPAPPLLAFLVSHVTACEKKRRSARACTSRGAADDAAGEEAGHSAAEEDVYASFVVDLEELCDMLMWCGIWELYAQVAVYCDAHHMARIKVAVCSKNMDVLKRACHSLADWQNAMRLALELLPLSSPSEQRAEDVRRIVLSMACALGPRAALESLRSCLEETHPVGFEKEAYLICKSVLAAHDALGPVAKASHEVLAAADSYLWSQRPAALPPQLALMLEQSLERLQKRYGRVPLDTSSTPMVTLAEAREILRDCDLARTLEDPHTHWGVSTQLVDTVCAASGLPLRSHYGGDGVLVSADGQVYLPSYADLANPM